MYHPEICNRRLWKIENELDIKFQRFNINDSMKLADSLDRLITTEQQQNISSEQQRFILNELFLSKWDFRYWNDRYARIVNKEAQLVPIRFWESQEIGFAHISDGELEAWKNQHDNLWLWLKARQLGATTVSQSMIIHRLIFHPNTKALIASDTPKSSLELSRKAKGLYENLPWWMKPSTKFDVKGSELYLEYNRLGDLKTTLIVGHGGVMKGGIGQGGTTHLFHLTEIPDWENWAQIDEDFLPAVPLLPTSFGVQESTARGQSGHWYDAFQAAWAGKSRSKALFIPWYAESQTYQRKPPTDWVPSKYSQEHAAKVARTSPVYCRGKTIQLSKEQLYWYERTYEEYKFKGRLPIFFQEYASDHLEAFQDPTGSLFPYAVIQSCLADCTGYQAYAVAQPA